MKYVYVHQKRIRIFKCSNRRLRNCARKSQVRALQTRAFTITWCQISNNRMSVWKQPLFFNCDTWLFPSLKLLSYDRQANNQIYSNIWYIAREAVVPTGVPLGFGIQYLNSISAGMFCTPFYHLICLHFAATMSLTFHCMYFQTGKTYYGVDNKLLVTVDDPDNKWVASSHICVVNSWYYSENLILSGEDLPKMIINVPKQVSKCEVFVFLTLKIVILQEYADYLSQSG